MPKQQRAERTRAAILKAAAAEFDAVGYEGARLDRIAEGAGATKGAMYFHFHSKMDLARVLIEEKYTNWPVIVAEVSGTGLRGMAAAEEITQRVASVFIHDVRVRAAMKLSQTVLPPPPEDNPYDRWIDLIAVFVGQAIEDTGAVDVDAHEIATVAVHGFFGAYTIAEELHRLRQLPGDVHRLWKTLATAVRAAEFQPGG